MSASAIGETDDILPARPAATVMVIRDVEPDPGLDPGIEVFVLRRTSGAAFAAGMFVFPGGRVDEVDSGTALEPYVHGLDDAEASRHLGIADGGLAFWVAAIRECFEESGLLLARRPDGRLPKADPTDRVAVHRGDLSMVDLCRKHDIALDAGALRYVAHWVTPLQERPRRFDTRFFLAAAPHGQQGVHDDAETVDSRWVRPSDALRDAAEGVLTMMPPTIANITFLDGCASVAEAIAKADAAGPPPRIQPKIRRDAEGRLVGFAFPGDPDYGDLS